MLNLWSILRKRQLYNFHGGVFLPETKSKSSGIALKNLPLPDKFIIPLEQHIGLEGELIVVAGQSVLRGQPLTVGHDHMLPVHASTSGTIASIVPRITANTPKPTKTSVILIPDGDDRGVLRQPLVDYYNYSSEQLLTRIYQSGIVGLGGAGFPTAVKLSKGLYVTKTLIINAAECEPYLTADDQLIREHASEIVTGINILHYLLHPQKILLGIEDNKPEALAALKNALGVQPICELRVIPTKYPSGSEKQLIKILTGQELSFSQHSSSIGVLMLNVSTIYFIKRAILDGEMLTERVVTLTGDALTKPGNFWVRLGTPVNHLLNYTGFKYTRSSQVIMGGALMGFNLSSLDIPIVKTSSCIIANSTQRISSSRSEQECIRCNRCANVCPVNLLPQQLYWFSHSQEHNKIIDYHLFDCIECGACTYVCPSNIPLVQYYRNKKEEIRVLDSKKQRALQAKVRYKHKINRHKQQDKQKRLVRYQQSIQLVNTITTSSLPEKEIRKAAVAAAIARAKARKQILK